MAEEGPPQYNVVTYSYAKDFNNDFFNGIARYTGNIEDYINAFNKQKQKTKSDTKSFTVSPNDARTAVYVDGAPEPQLNEQGIIYKPKGFVGLLNDKRSWVALQRVGFPGNPWNNTSTASCGENEVLNSCGPKKEELASPAQSEPVKTTVGHVRDLGFFLRGEKTQKKGSLQQGEPVSLGGGYCVFWMRYIAKKLAEEPPERLWDLERSQYSRYSEHGVYMTIYAEASKNASNSDWKNEKNTELINMALGTQKPAQRIIKGNPTNERLCPFSSTAFAHNQLFRARVLQPLSAGKFRMATSSNKGYDVHASDGQGTWASKEFIALVNTDSTVPILFFASISLSGQTVGHALCCIYIPAKANRGKSQIDIISTYALPQNEVDKFKTLNTAPDSWSSPDADAKAGGRRLTRRVSKRKSRTSKRKKTQQRRNWFA